MIISVQSPFTPKRSEPHFFVHVLAAVELILCRQLILIGEADGLLTVCQAVRCAVLLSLGALTVFDGLAVVVIVAIAWHFLRIRLPETLHLLRVA